MKQCETKITITGTLLLITATLWMLSSGLYAGISSCLEDRLYFTENCGQWDEQVLFRADGAGGLTWWIERDGFTLSYFRKDRQIEHELSPKQSLFPDDYSTELSTQRSHSLKFKFIYNSSSGSNSLSSFYSTPDLSATASTTSSSDRLSWNNNYFLGKDQSKWAPDCGNYMSVTLYDVWEGVDVEWYGVNGLVEFDFIVHPGADPSQIGLRIGGLEGEFEVTEGGEELLLPTSLGELRLVLPEAWNMDKNGNTTDISACFIQAGENRLSISLPEGYDPGQKLVIDPLVYSTILGGVPSMQGEGDAAFRMVSDGEGGVILTGMAESREFPVTEGAFQEEHAGSAVDAFVTHLSPDGEELLFSIYLGGDHEDVGWGVTFIDGAVVVAGNTESENFPVTEGVIQENLARHTDIFIARLNEDGSELTYSTYLGGNSGDRINAMIPDGDGGVVITGQTGSSDFPITDGAYQEEKGNGVDAYITCINEDGSEVNFSTFLGGDGVDYANDLALDDNGEIVVVGATSSEDFPATEGVFQEDISDHQDAFIARLNDDVSELIYSTYLGGGEMDGAEAVVIDNAGGVILTGRTMSNDFPTTDGVIQEDVERDIYDVAFITRLNDDASDLVFSTFLGGEFWDQAFALALDHSGVTVVGRTAGDRFPITEENAFQSVYGGGGSDAFITRINLQGNALFYSTYLGGGSYDMARSIIWDGTSGVIVSGTTRSTRFPTTDGAFQETLSERSAYDAFITHIDIGILDFWWAEIEELIEAIETDTIEFTVRGESANENADLSITYQSDDLPDVVEFEDHGDGSGTFTWQTTYADSGRYTAVFTLSDNEDEFSTNVTIIVHNLNSVPQPFNLLSPEDDFQVRYDPDSLGRVDLVWEEAAQDSLDSDVVSYKIMFFMGLLQYTIGPLELTSYEPAIQMLADSMRFSREREKTIDWNVLAIDSEEQVISSNGPWSFTIPVLDVDPYSNPELPASYSLSSPYPNPFNASTRLTYNIAKPGLVTLKLFDITGRQVRVLEDGNRQAGRYEYILDAGDLAAGVYLVRLESNNNAINRKIVLVK